MIKQQLLEKRLHFLQFRSIDVLAENIIETTNFQDVAWQHIRPKPNFVDVRWKFRSKSWSRCKISRRRRFLTHLVEVPASK